MLGDRAIDHAPQVRTDLVGAALVEAVAGRAFLGRLLAVLDAGRRQQHADRLRLGSRRRLATARLGAAASTRKTGSSS